MLNLLFVFTMAFIVMFIGIALICTPIMIAESRGITGGTKLAIIILSWLGIFFGVTWVLALILSLTMSGDALYGTDNLDKLEKLSKLYKDKVITKQEYETMKARLMK